MIPDFKTYVGESVWGDIRRRGNGGNIKLEDDDTAYLSDLSFNELYDYLNNLLEQYDGHCYLNIFNDDDMKELSVGFYKNSGDDVPTFSATYEYKVTKNIWGNVKPVFIDYSDWNIYDKIMDVIQPPKIFSTKTITEIKKINISLKDTTKSNNVVFVRLIEYLMKVKL